MLQVTDVHDVFSRALSRQYYLPSNYDWTTLQLGLWTELVDAKVSYSTSKNYDVARLPVLAVLGNIDTFASPMNLALVQLNEQYSFKSLSNFLSGTRKSKVPCHVYYQFVPVDRSNSSENT